jgi:hypothetical protein
MALVSLIRYAQTHVEGTDAMAVIAALIDQPKDAEIVKSLAIVFDIASKKPGILAPDALDIALARAGDIEKTDVSDKSLDGIATYLSTQLSTLPEPIPRSLLQPLAQCLVDNDTKPTRGDAVEYLLSTYKFV